MAVLISPVFNIPAFTDANGNPLNGGRIYQYEAGSSSVLKTTYTTSAGDVANANPIVLNSAGQLPTSIWLTSGEFYNLVLTAADGTTVIKGFDNVAGADTSTGGAATAEVWVNDGAATYVAPTQFLIVGNYATEFAIGNRARVTTGSGFKYGTVTNITFSSPNSTVTLAMDTGTLDVSVSAVAHSLLISGGRTVDAGGVSYFSTITYGTLNTVGNKIQLIDTDIAQVNAQVDSLRKVWTATLSGSAYTVTTTPAVTSYTIDQVLTVKFATARSGASTINFNGVGAVSLKVYDYAGVKQDPTILINTVTDVAYDGTDFVILDQLPPSPAVAAPHGMQVFDTNGTFVVPASVASLKVTCVGGGGGGGHGYDNVGTIYYGGTGGTAAQSITYLSVSPGDTLAVSIGAGGTGGIYYGTAPTSGGSTTVGSTLATAAGGTAATNASPSANGSNGTNGSTGTGFVLTGWPLGTQYGNGGAGSGGILNGNNGKPGVVLIEW